MMKRFVGSGPLLFVTCCVGCGASVDGESVRPDEPASASAKTFVGTVSGTDAVVAVSESSGSWVAYVCGGSQSYGSLTHWFHGEIDERASSGEIRGQDGAIGLAAVRTAGWVRGALVDPASSLSYSFDAHAIDVEAGKLAGLYSAVDSGCRTGLVAIPGSDSVQGVWCNGAGSFAQVTPILPIDLTQGGLRVRVEGVDRQLYMKPAVLPLL